LSHPTLPKSVALALLLFGVASLYGYWMYARRRQHPLFSLKLFEVKSFKLGLIGNLLARTGAASMPFLIPLMLQLALGYDPSKAGMMMLPVAAAGMAAKPIITRLIRRYGYRQVLIGNTLMIGTMIASFALTSSTQPVWVQVMHLALFGAVNSMQFTAMNTITLRDLGSEGASSGNSMLSVTQMLAMSLGVTVGGGLLGVFSGMAGGGGNTLPAFHATFICVGLITSASAFIFWRLAPDRTAVR
jgi:predicted MFS family arabinose efflux permease